MNAHCPGSTVECSHRFTCTASLQLHPSWQLTHPAGASFIREIINEHTTPHSMCTISLMSTSHSVCTISLMSRCSQDDEWRMRPCTCESFTATKPPPIHAFRFLATPRALRLASSFTEVDACVVPSARHHAHRPVLRHASTALLNAPRRTCSTPLNCCRGRQSPAAHAQGRHSERQVCARPWDVRGAAQASCPRDAAVF